MKIKFVLISLMLLSGCSYFYLQSDADKKNHAENAISGSIKSNTPEMSITKAYEIAATRITNKMLDDTTDIYEVNPASKLYVNKIRKDSPELSDGLYAANRSIKEIIKGSGTYMVVDKLEDADFILDSSVSNVKNDTNPTIVLKMNIKDKNNTQAKSWTVTIKQMTEDRSWW